MAGLLLLFLSAMFSGCLIVSFASLSLVSLLDVRDSSRALYLQLTHISGLAFVRHVYH